MKGVKAYTVQNSPMDVVLTGQRDGLGPLEGIRHVAVKIGCNESLQQSVFWLVKASYRLDSNCGTVALPLRSSLAEKFSAMSVT